jgi:hypothetical protein
VSRQAKPSRLPRPDVGSPGPHKAYTFESWVTSPPTEPCGIMHSARRSSSSSLERIEGNWPWPAPAGAVPRTVAADDEVMQRLLSRP